MKKNPILIFTGAAVAAVAALTAVTKDKWMPSSQTEVAEPAISSGSSEPATTAEQPAAEQETAAVQPSPETEQGTAADAAGGAMPGVPTFDTVRVEKTGEAVIAGRAEPGAEVVVKLNGQAIGKATANADGAFVITPEAPLAAGSGTLTLEATGPGSAEPKVSQQSVAVIVPEGAKQEALVAVMSPDQPTKVLQKPGDAGDAQTASGGDATSAAGAAKQVSIDAVDYDDSGNIVFSGQGEPGGSVRLYVDNAAAGDAKIGDDGRWSFAGAAEIAAGNHALRVDSLDAEGKVLSRVEVPFVREDKTKVASAGTGEQATEAASEEAPEATSAADTGPKEGRIVIQPGNNLWRISKVIYGDGLKYAVLYDANKDQIRDPDLIYPGQVFRTPDVEPPEDIDPNASEPLAQSGSTAQ